MPKFRNILYFMIFSCLLLTGCSGNNTSSTSNWVAGDQLYIPDGYSDKLVKMGLVEIVPMPYFNSPFITVAKDKNEKQYAVLFYDNGKIDKKKLITPYEKI